MSKFFVASMTLVFTLLTGLVSQVANAQFVDTFVAVPPPRLLKHLQNNLCADPVFNSEPIAYRTPPSVVSGANITETTAAGAGCTECDVKAALAPTRLADVTKDTGPVVKALQAATENERIKNDLAYFIDYEERHGPDESAKLKEWIDSLKKQKQDGIDGIAKVKAQVANTRDLSKKLSEAEVNGSVLASDEKKQIAELLDLSLENAPNFIEQFPNMKSQYEASIEDYGKVESNKTMVAAWKKEISVYAKGYEVKSSLIESVKAFADWLKLDETAGRPSPKSLADARVWLLQAANEAELSIPGLEAQNQGVDEQIAGNEKQLVAQFRKPAPKKIVRSELDKMTDQQLRDWLKIYEGRFREKLTQRSGDYAPCGMSVAEIHALRTYTASGYGNLNRALRSAGEAREKARPFENVLNSALAKLRSFDGVVKRGGTLPPAVLAQHKVGDVVSYAAFTSTSVAFGFNSDHRFIIKSKSGKYIAPYSSMPGEEEVLFPSNTKFKILSREEAGKKTVFIMEEVTDTNGQTGKP